MKRLSKEQFGAADCSVFDAAMLLGSRSRTRLAKRHLRSHLGLGTKLAGLDQILQGLVSSSTKQENHPPMNT